MTRVALLPLDLQALSPHPTNMPKMLWLLVDRTYK